MVDSEYNFLLQDRIAKIKAINKEYDLEHNAYISFSGGKDSTILHHLIDMALPNNHIPRVFVNTGIEYLDIVKYVKRIAQKDERIIILNSGVNIRNMLNTYGYPFKSKEHSLRVYQFNKNPNAPFLQKYIKGITKDGKPSKFKCPKILKYQFNTQKKYNYSDRCCYELKKKPAYKWSKQNNKTIVITGMKHEEKGNRERLTCITHKNNQIMFHPLIVIKEKWENQFIEKNKIKLCKLYYEPYNFKRTGCRGCPFNKYIQKDLDTMDKLLPYDYKASEHLWKPVYDEYRRLGYRLRKDKSRQITIDEILN